jgi:hypothetical protein
MKIENEYPCERCKSNEDDCNRQRKYLRCYAWREWFRSEWNQIRNFFGKDVSERHNEKGGDDD